MSTKALSKTPPDRQLDTKAAKTGAAVEGSDYWRRGVYREVVEPEQLVFTYISDDPENDPDHETIVTVTFADHGAKTLMTFRQAEFESIASRDSHRHGWTSCMERFAAYLARAAP